MIDDPEIQLALDEKQDEILTGMPVPQDGKVGDIRTNVAHKGKVYSMMKVGIGEDAWRYSSPYTRTPSIHTMDDYLLKSGGKMLDGAFLATDEIRARDGDGLKLYDDGGNGIFVKDGGNTGFENVSPSYAVHVGDGAGSPSIHIQKSSAGEARLSFSTTAGQQWYINYDSAENLTLRSGVTDKDFTIRLQDTHGGAAAAYNYLVIDSSAGVVSFPTGNVGIGTATPTHSILDVHAAHAIIKTEGSSTARFRMQDTGAAGGKQSYEIASEGDIFRISCLSDVWDAYVTQYGLVMNSAGNVGIGTSSPGTELEVVGTITTDGFIANLVSKSANYTATASDYAIVCDASGGSFTITLPAVASHVDRIYHVKKIDVSGNTVTVDGNSSETIDDGLTTVLTTQYEAITIQSDGGEWWIL